MSSVNSGSYWTEVHKIFTRYEGIIYTVNAHIAVVISHSVFECQSDECREFAIFTNWLPWQHPSRYQSSEPKMLLFGEKITKIGPADPEIIKEKRTKKERN